MKQINRALLFPVLVLLILFCITGGSAAEATTRKLTVLVYMCGSNLESLGGSASADIREMTEANVNRQQIGLLVMTGGSDTESGDFSSGKTRILEIAGGRKRIVQEEDALNMGEGDTLVRFIRYGMENRPAEQYALILWDHGGGPLEGVCWDETHDMDHLSLAELTGALAEALPDRKLSWIGFDACLMSSLEIAGQLSPYADYMIASQETEPAIGWNYSFLSGIENDTDGAETGRRIVDAYFEGQEDSREILTLACTDLSAAEEAIRAMDPVFSPLSKRLDRQQFLSLSGLRMSTTGFGKAAPEASATGYDLVDVRDLVSRFDTTEEAEAFLKLLDRAVVYSRSNEEGANGLTLYHPYANKTGYTDKWKDGYGQLAFSTGYQAYVDAFGGMLTGEILFRWLDLIPRTPAARPDGSYTFELPLTEEQAENMVSAQLLIIRDTQGNQLDMHCVLIASCRAELGEDSILRAAWDGRALFAESGSGTTAGPISYMQTDDGKTNTIIGAYIPENDYYLNVQTVIFEMDAENQAEYPEFTRIRVWDEATQSFSSRMSLTEDGFGSLQFWNYHRILPATEADRTMPGFESWEYNGDGVVTTGFSLPDTWRFHEKPLESGQQIYALFRILDSQQNVVCSLPIAVPDSRLTLLQPVSGTVQTEELRADLSCTVNTSPDAFGLQMEWNLQSSATEQILVHLENPVLNGTRIVNGKYSEYLNPGETERLTLSLDPYDTIGLDTLKSISGTLEISMTASGEKQDIPFCFLFESGNVSALNREMNPLAETEQDGISLKILSIESAQSTGWNLVFLAANNTEEEYPLGDILLNGIYISADFRDTLPAGTEKIYSIHENNTIYSSVMEMTGIDAPGILVYLENDVLQAMGQRELTHVKVTSYHVNEMERRVFDLPLKTPFTLGEEHRSAQDSLLIAVVNPPETLASPPEDALPVLAENNLFRVKLRRFVAGKENAAMSLEWTNETDEWLHLGMHRAIADGSTRVKTVTLPPYATVLTDVTVLPDAEALKDLGPECRELRLLFSDDDRFPTGYAVPATVTSPEAISLGQEGGIWINGDRFTVTPARFPDQDPEQERSPKPMEETLLLPENPEACRKVIEVPLDPETEARISFCRVAVIRKSSDDYWQVLTLNDVKPDGSGILKIPHPGMIQTVAGHSEIGLMTWYKGIDTDILKGNVWLEIIMTTSDANSFTCYPVSWELERSSGSARITELVQDQAPYTRQWQISTAKFITYEIRIQPNADGTMPYISECEIRSDFDWYLNLPAVQLANRPLQLELRPITPEDDLYVMVSAVGTDDTHWSLPVFPYPVS